MTALIIPVMLMVLIVAGTVQAFRNDHYDLVHPDAWMDDEEL